MQIQAQIWENFNLFLANGPILYPLKTVVSGGIKWEHWPEIG